MIAGLVALVAAPIGACQRVRSDGRLRIAVETAPLTLDPRGPFNADTAHVQQLVYNTLVTKGPDFDLAPELATSWVASADFTSHTFVLRDGVRFHDGRALTSRDVAFTFESLARGAFGKSANFHALDRVEPLDDHTVRFVSRTPNPGLLVDLVAVGVLPDGTGDDASIGTGPYRVASFDRDGPTRLDAFPEYFGGSPRAAGIDVSVIPDSGTRESALAAGEVDLAINTAFAPEAVARLGRPDATTRVVEAEGGAVQYVALNVEKRPLDDPRLRRALAIAIDRAKIVDTLLGGRATLASGPLPPSHWAKAAVEPTPFDPDAARALVRDSFGATTVRFELLTLTTGADVTLASVFQEQWRRAGVEVSIVTAEPATFFERLTYGDFSAALHRFTGGNQFTTIFKGAFHSRSIHTRSKPGGEINYARLADPELDLAIDRADLATSRAERVRLYADVQERIARAACWIPLWHPRNVAVLGPRVPTLALNPGGDFYCLRSGPLVDAESP